VPASQSHLTLPLGPRKPVRVDWEGGELSSDGGWLLIAGADRALRLTERLAAEVHDPRAPAQLRHSRLALLRQRIYQIALGYADGNDAQTLRHDPLLKTAVGRTPRAAPLAGQSTFSRFENAATAEDLARLEGVLQDLFVEQCGPAPREIVLDLDPYDDPCHGEQQGVLFNGYYDGHCYLPLLFCGTVDGGQQHLIGVVLRGGKAPATQEALGFLEDLVDKLRLRFPQVPITVRGDAGYGVEEMLTGCRNLGVEFCFGKATNAVLHRQTQELRERVDRAEAVRDAQGKRQKSCRAFAEVAYQAKSWPRGERVVAKAEVTYGKPNPRFVVTSLTPAAGWSARRVYQFYCARGDRENRIKEFKLDMAGDRLSCSTFLANQFRLVLHAAAFMLVQALQAALRQVAPGQEIAQAQAVTLRVKLLKVAARVIETSRAIRVHLCTAYPWQRLWMALAQHYAPHPA
jgi:hypothetical protein